MAIKSNKPPVLMPAYNHFPVAFERGEGAYLFDKDDKKYLDFASGIAVKQLRFAIGPGFWQKPA